MIQLAGQQQPSTRLKALGALAILVAFGAWAFASPVGASPDEDFHLVSIWCAHGTSQGACEPGPTSETRLVPAELPTSRCYAFYPDTSAACQTNPPVAPGMVPTERGNFTGLYPPVFYWVNGLFVGDDVATSVIVMRLFNAVLYVALIAALYVLVPPGLKRPLVGGALVTAVPLGVFLIPSINPSSWGLLSAATLLVALVGFLKADSRARQIQLGVLAGLSLLVAAGARADSAMFAVVAVGAAVIFTVRFERRYLRRLIFPAVLVVIAVATFLTAGQSVHADAGSSTPPFSIGKVISIAMDVPTLWYGGLGGWPLGWLDTVMRPVVPVSAWTVYAGVVFLAIAGAGLRRGLAFGAVAFAALAVPTYVQFLTGYEVGNVVQARYVLPLLTMVAITAMIRLDGAAFRLSRAQRWVVAGLLTIANAVALHTNIRRYVTGRDVHGLNLDSGIEWWWSGPISPLMVWALGAVAFGLGVVLLTNEFTTAVGADDTPGTRSVGGPAARMTDPSTEVGGTRTTVGAIQARPRNETPVG